MTKIIPFDDSPIVDEVSMAKKLHNEVKELKQSLIIGQVGWLKAGKHLCELQKDELYKYSDSQRDVSWEEFLDDPELPFPGNTKGSRIRTAQKLMTVTRTFVDKYKKKESLLSEVGYTKLALAASVLNRDENADVDEWLEKAKNLTTRDLQDEVSDGGKTLVDIHKCKHDGMKVFMVKKCKDCGLYEREEITA